MIHNTQTVNIDGTTLNKEALEKAFSFNNNDTFSRWVLRPLAILMAIGMSVAMFFASAFIIVLSLAMIPLLAISFWVVKTKVERDIANADPVVDTQSAVSEKPAESGRTAT